MSLRLPELRRFLPMMIFLTFLIWMLSSGCRLGGAELKTVHVFVGDVPIRGAVQIATNDPIRVISLDTAGNAHVETRDLGQFVAIPPHVYREMVRRLKAPSK